MMPSDLPAAAYEALVQFLYLVPIGLVQAELDGRITMINPMSARLLMPLAPAGELANLFDVLDPVAPELRRLAAAFSEPGAVLCDELRVALPPGPGAAPAVTLSLHMLRLDASTFMLSVSDVTAGAQQEKRRLDTQLRRARRVDTLTSMPNRTAVTECIERAAARRGEDAEYRYAVLFINADRFDRINLAHGTAGGDALLRLMAGRLTAAVRARDSVGRAGTAERTTARLGGDEFVVVLEDIESQDAACSVASRLLETLCAPYAIGDATVHSSVSVGIVLPGDDTADADDVLHDASLAMRDAKRSGGACLRVFEPEMKEAARRRGALESELRQALVDGDLYVVYQPIVELPGGSVAAVEALVRWRHAVRGVVSPVEFIEIAEQTGLIHPLGAFVLRSACAQLADWQRSVGARAPRSISVNVSRAQLGEPGIVADVRAALEASGLDPACLQLEVTESLAAQDQVVRDRLLELKRLGVTLALDDFGTGYSSLACLHLLPIDVVKIDRSFVMQAESSTHHRVLIDATVRVARSLGMGTVAEGVETAGQADIIASLQCDKGQGYLWSRPLPAEEATRWLQSRDAPAPGG